MTFRTRIVLGSACLLLLAAVVALRTGRGSPRGAATGTASLPSTPALPVAEGTAPRAPHPDAASSHRRQRTEQELTVRVSDGERPVSGATISYLEHAQPGWDEDVARQHGVVVHSDGEGLARMPLPPAGATLRARRGELYGEVTVAHPRSDGVVQIPLEPHLTVPVQVLDATGHGVAGVDLLLVTTVPEDENGRVAHSASDLVAPGQPHTTDQQGWHVFRAPWTRMAPAFAQQRRARVVAQVGGDSLWSSTVDPTAATPPVALSGGPRPVRLWLPPVGSIVVELDEALRCMSPQVWLHGPGHASLSLDPDGAPSVTFAPVMTGGLYVLEARVDTIEVARLQMVGPPAAGATARARLAPDPKLSILIGRLLGPGGDPLAKARLTVEGDPGDVVAFARTDVAGRFAWCLPREPARTDPTTLWVIAEPDGERPPLWTPASLPPNLRAGVLDLGDVRLELPPLVCAGSVVSGEGAPLPQHVSVDLRAENDKLVRGARYRAHCDAAGHFQVRGRVPGDRAKLLVRAPRHVPVAVPFAYGTADLRVALARCREGAATDGPGQRH